MPNETWIVAELHFLENNFVTARKSLALFLEIYYSLDDLLVAGQPFVKSVPAWPSKGRSKNQTVNIQARTSS